MNMLQRFRSTILPIRFFNETLPDHGTIYEIGSGYGTLALDIAKAYENRMVIGIDSDPQKIQISKQNIRLQNIQFIHANALTYGYKNIDGVVMSDFLHHISYANQEKLIHSLVKKMNKKSVLLIKEIDDTDGIRKWCSRLWDLLLYPHDRIYYRSRVEWVSILSAAGFTVSSRRFMSWFPGSTIVYQAHL